MAVHMVRAITTVAIFLLTTGSVVHAEDRAPSFPDPGIKSCESEIQQLYFHSVDMNISPRKYEEIVSRNRNFVYKNLRSYSKDVLDMIGIPEQGGYLVGAALGLAINGGTGLDLNKSKTLALEFKDVDKPERSLFFRINLDW